MMRSWIELRSCFVSHSYASGTSEADLTSLTSSALCNGFSSAGLEGKEVMITA